MATGEVAMAYTRAAMERAMKVADVLLHALKERQPWIHVAEVLGVSPRTVRRLRWRYEHHGFEQSFEPVVLVAPAQTTHGPRAHAQDLGHVDPRLTLLESVQQDVGNLHGPLHCSPGVGHRHLPGGHDSPAACVERSDHLLSGAVR